MRLTSLLSALVLSLGPLGSLAETYKNNAFVAPLGGDIVTAGKVFNIKWINLDGGIINLVLVRGDPNNLSTVGAIATGIPNTGDYIWNVPEDTNPGNDYAIEIQAGAAKNFTPQFTIVQSPDPTPTEASYPATTTTTTTSTSATGSATTFVEKTDSASAPKTDEVDPTTLVSSNIVLTTDVVDSEVSLTYPTPTETTIPTESYGTLTLIYPTTLVSSVNGSSTTWVGNQTHTTTNVASPTDGSLASSLRVWSPLSLALLALGTLVLL